MISYLPLAHMYERICQVWDENQMDLCTVFIYSKWQIWFPFTFQLYMYINGCQVGFYRGDVKLLMEDIGALKPTVFPTVPRLLNRVYDKVHQFFFTRSHRE